MNTEGQDPLNGAQGAQVNAEVSAAGVAVLVLGFRGGEARVIVCGVCVLVGSAQVLF